MKRKFKSVFTLLTGVVFSLAMVTVPVKAETASEAEYNVSNEVLYFDADGNIGYNVVHQFTVTNDTVISDSTGRNISTLEDIKKENEENAVTASLNVDENEQALKINVTSVVKRPVIGISWKSDKIGSDYQNFAEAYRRNGAKAVFLPQFKTEADAEKYLADNGIDGIFETGGSDVNPYFYNELQTPYGSGNPNTDRDISDIALIKVAVKNNVPLLGVCRGEQIFNVAMGGGLIQDIPYYFGQKVKSGEIDADRVTKVLCGTLPGHDASENVADTGYLKRDFSELPAKADASGEKTFEEGALRVWIDGYIHSGAPSYHKLDNAAIDSSSKWMYKIAGGDSIDLVATAHHQAVNPDKLGEGLTIVARSADGIVEGIEYQKNLFALGIQFHPERDALGDSAQAVNNGMNPDQDTCNRFLRALVMYASVHDGSLTVEDVEGTKDNPGDIDNKPGDNPDNQQGDNTDNKPAENVDNNDNKAQNTDNDKAAETVSTDKNSGNVPQTGDDTSIPEMVLLSIAIITSAAAIVIIQKKYKCEK